MPARPVPPHASDAASVGAPTPDPLEITMRMQATIEVTGLRKRFGPAVALEGLLFTVLPLAPATAGGLGMAWPGPGVAAEGVGVGGGELPDAVEEVADYQELVVGVVSEQVPGAADEVAEDFLVPGGGGLGGLHQLAAAVAGIGPPADVPGLLQAVQDGGHPAGGEAEQPGQGGGGERAGPAEDIQGAHVSAVEAVPVGGSLVEPVDLGAQRPEAADDLAEECPLGHNSLPI